MAAEAEAECDVKADKERDTSSAVEDDEGDFSDCFYYEYSSYVDNDLWTGYDDSDFDAEDESSSAEHGGFGGRHGRGRITMFNGINKRRKTSRGEDQKTRNSFNGMA